MSTDAAKGSAGLTDRGETGDTSKKTHQTSQRERDNRDRNRDSGSENRDRESKASTQRESDEVRGRDFLSRVKGLFESNEDEPKDIAGPTGEVVAQSFRQPEEPTTIRTVDFNEREGFETMVPDANPHEEYARSVIDAGLIGQSPEEKQVASDISAAGRQAQAVDIGTTLASAALGPIGALPGVAYDVATGIQDDPIQQAGQSLYEGGKTNIPGASTAISKVMGPTAGTAFDLATSVFGGGDLSAFEEAAGVQTPTQQNNLPRVGGRDSGDSQYASVLPTQQPATMGQAFQMGSWNQNLYSDFLNNFFKG